MASYQVLPAPQPTSFPGFTQGLNQYVAGVLKDRRSRQQAQEKQSEAEKRITDFEKAISNSNLEPSGASYDDEGNIRYNYARPQREPKLSFNDAARKAISGETDFENLGDMYPSRFEAVKKIESRYTPAQMSEEFTPGTGGMVSRLKSFMSPTQAEITPETQKVIDNIKTEYDLNELISAQKGYENAGVDVKAVLEYFGAIAKYKGDY